MFVWITTCIHIYIYSVYLSICLSINLSTMSWRETLFVWKGEGSFHEQNNNMKWEGKWCGTDQPDEKHFPKENEFKESKMLFFSVNMIVIIMRKISNIS